MSFWMTWFACGQRRASQTWPRSSQARALRSSSLDASSRARCTSRQPAASCESSQTLPFTLLCSEPCRAGASRGAALGELAPSTQATTWRPYLDAPSAAASPPSWRWASCRSAPVKSSSVRRTAWCPCCVHARKTSSPGSLRMVRASSTCSSWHPGSERAVLMTEQPQRSELRPRMWVLSMAKSGPRWSCGPHFRRCCIA
mmetsp:Transcript_76910/g.201795  ORF Transcript_76910/g.201795 Transcript_76910/m.201795 type:complete len:200 (+) Transcript_76910:417-1016(+)